MSFCLCTVVDKNTALPTKGLMEYGKNVNEIFISIMTSLSALTWKIKQFFIQFVTYCILTNLDHYNFHGR